MVNSNDLNRFSLLVYNNRGSKLLFPIFGDTRDDVDTIALVPVDTGTEVGWTNVSLGIRFTMEKGIILGLATSAGATTATYSVGSSMTIPNGAKLYVVYAEGKDPDEQSDSSNGVSILNSVKLGIGGIPEEYTAFDSTLVMYINGVFQRFHQLGVGPTSAPFTISGANETWEDFFGGAAEPSYDMELCKADMILRVRLMFDSPSSSYGIENIKELIREYEWTMNVDADSGDLTI